MNALVEAAYQYLGLGLQVIALTGKTPNVAVHRTGLYDALTFENSYGQVERVFNHTKTTGIGILTNDPLVVVDIDGEEGAVAWKDLVGAGDYIPDRWVAKTGRGLHLYMATLQPTGSLKLGEKLDLKGHGGYVAAPPSRHPDGGTYEWLLPPDGPVLEVPEALAAVVHARAFEREGLAVTRAQRKRIRHAPLEDGKFYAAWGFDALIQGMIDADSGNRNNYLHWAAATMAEEGALPEEFESLRQAAGHAGLTRLETQRTIRSARRARDA